MKRANAPLVTTLLILSRLPIAAHAQPSGLDTLKPITRTRVACSVQAAIRFELPANLVIAVAEQEGGRIGQWVKNPNGSYDVGPMQFNTSYLRTLERFGITPQDVEASGCYPYELAAWRLRRHLELDAGDLWTRAANYHSRTPAFNARYRTAILSRAAKWAQWLSAHVPVAEIASVAPAPSHPSPPPPPRATTTRLAARTRARPATLTSRRVRAAPRVPATPATEQHNTDLAETLASSAANRHAALVELVANTNVTAPHVDHGE